MISSLVVATAFFAGCGESGGGGGGGYVPPPGPGPEPEQYDALYLENANGVGMANVQYNCPSGPGITDGDGTFLFYSGENCTFDLAGFNGSIYYNDYLYIDYNDGSGVSGIAYDCASGTGGATDFNGNFDYDVDDECTFAL